MIGHYVSATYNAAVVSRLDHAYPTKMTIELTEDQIRVLSEPHACPPCLVNPRTNEAFVLLPVDEYKKLAQDAYDDTPWTREELAALAWDVAEHGAVG